MTNHLYALDFVDADEYRDQTCATTVKNHIHTKVAAFRAELEARGETIADYCRRQGLDYEAMHRVLRGRSQGRRGKSHQVFVALGLKTSRSE